MALKFADRVQETTSTTGTGAYSLGGAKTGFQAFSAFLSSTDTTYYTATDGTNWEVGVGTFTSPSTLARTTILSSSNGNAAVSWSAGDKDIFVTYPAGRRVIGDNLSLNITGTTGGGNLVFAFNPSLSLPNLGTVNSGDITACTLDITTAVSQANNAGYRGIPLKIDAFNYTLQGQDMGRAFVNSSASTALTVTIPASSTYNFPVGTAVSFIGKTFGLTIQISSPDVLRFSNTGATGTRTLSAWGMATAVKIESSPAHVWLISGNGLT
jgi:hypothetical protein